ncbi:DUF7660 family protein [Streptomyces luteogriseus]
MRVGQERHRQPRAGRAQLELLTRDRFLDALAAWIRASLGWCRNSDQEMPPNGDWALFARALSAAIVYE